MTPGDEYKGPDRRRGGPDRRDPNAKVKILLVDDHALFRVGMRQILDAAGHESPSLSRSQS